MKLVAPYKCDYCSKLKGESNHWFLHLTESSVGRINGVLPFVLIPWEATAAEQPEAEHICGQECAAKALAAWMAKQ